MSQVEMFEDGRICQVSNKPASLKNYEVLPLCGYAFEDRERSLVSFPGNAMGLLRNSLHPSKPS